MKNLAAYLAKQPVKAGTAKNKDTIMLGQSIYRGGIGARVEILAFDHHETIRSV